MNHTLSHKIALKPNRAQEDYFRRACGTARFAYNWALAEWNRQYEAWKKDNSLPKPSAAALGRQLNAIKREKFPWMLEVTKCAPQRAIQNLGEAFKRYFKNKSKFNHPKFKKKGKSRDSFYIDNTVFKVEDKRIKIPKLGEVRMRENLRFEGKILSATTRLLRRRGVR